MDGGIYIFGLLAAYWLGKRHRRELTTPRMRARRVGLLAAWGQRGIR